jgi:hypothetical protein
VVFVANEQMIAGMLLFCRNGMPTC